MSLLDALTEPPRPKGHKLDEILDVLEQGERTALLNALSNPAVWSSEALANLLRGHGHKVSSSSVRRYRADVLRVTA